MSKTVRVSNEFHSFVKAHKREDETMEETLRRLIGGPHPEIVSGILTTDTAESIRGQLSEKYEQEIKSKRNLKTRFECSSIPHS